MSGLLPLKWQAQPEQIQQALERMYQDLDVYQGLTDMTLVSSEGEMVEAHATILAMISPYFQRIFTKVQKRRRSADTVVILGNVKSSHLRTILRFIYTGKADISSNGIDELKEAAKVFEIEGLFSTACSQPNQGTRISTRSTAAATSLCNNNDGGDHVDDTSTSHFFDDFQGGASENDVEPYSEPEMKPRTSTNNIVQNDANSDESSSSSNNDDSDSSYDADGGGKSKRKKRKRVDRRLDPKTGMLIGFQGTQHNWTKRTDEVTDEELETCWRRRKIRRLVSKTVFVYFCKKAMANKCPVMLKREECKETKEVTYYINDAEHNVAAHRTKPVIRLQQEEKEFLNSITRDGTKYMTLTEALGKFKKAGREAPPKNLVESFLKTVKRRKLKALNDMADDFSNSKME